MSAKKTKTEKRAVWYIRVSASDQADHGISLGAQEACIRDRCALNGYALGEIKVDLGLSGGLADIQLVTENPYLLVPDIRDIGFKTADQIAQKLGDIGYIAGIDMDAQEVLTDFDG